MNIFVSMWLQMMDLSMWSHMDELEGIQNTSVSSYKQKNISEESENHHMGWFGCQGNMCHFV